MRRYRLKINGLKQRTPARLPASARVSGNRGRLFAISRMIESEGSLKLNSRACRWRAEIQRARRTLLPPSFDRSTNVRRGIPSRADNRHSATKRYCRLSTLTRWEATVAMNSGPALNSQRNLVVIDSGGIWVELCGWMCRVVVNFN